MDIDNNQKSFCVLCCFTFVSSLMIIMFALSWSAVDPLYYGLNCNSLSKKCDSSNILGSGRYFIGFTNYLIPFPSNYQTIEFSTKNSANAPPLRSRTKEGLSLTLHVSFQYQIIKEEVYDLYAMSNKDYEQTFIRIARDTILQQAGNYEAPQYWLKRKEITLDMFKELNNNIRDAHAVIMLLQILQIDLPETYENSIVETQVEVQRSQTKQFEQEAELIRQSINVMSSQTAQEIAVINATAVADAYLIKQEAIANATKVSIQAESDAYLHAKNVTELSGKDLNNYIFYNSLLDHQNGKLLVGLNNAIVNFNGVQK